MTAKIPPWVPDTGGEDFDDWDVHYDDAAHPCECCEDEAAVTDGLCDECLDHGQGVCFTPVLTVRPLERYL